MGSKLVFRASPFPQFLSCSFALCSPAPAALCPASPLVLPDPALASPILFWGHSTPVLRICSAPSFTKKTAPCRPHRWSSESVFHTHRGQEAGGAVPVPSCSKSREHLRPLVRRLRKGGSFIPIKRQAYENEVSPAGV